MKESQSKVAVETRGAVSVAEIKGSSHRFYEDRSRMLVEEIPIVAEADRGGIVAVFDGVGSAPMGMRAAQMMADSLIEFFTEPEKWRFNEEELKRLILESNQEIFEWGFMDGTDRPLGAAAGTVAWIIDGTAVLFHAGDTEAWLWSKGEMIELLGDQERSNSIVEYFGKGPGLELTVSETEYRDGDRLLLFSDGLRKCVPQASIARILGASAEPAEIVYELVKFAEKMGALDDVTALVIQL